MGEQIFIKSQKAFNTIKFIKAEEIPYNKELVAKIKADDNACRYKGIDFINKRREQVARKQLDVKGFIREFQNKVD